MTIPPDRKKELAEFERALGVQIRVADSAADSGETFLQMTTLGVTGAEFSLALILDLSDSSDATARLIGRLPPLLAGWPREAAVWVYALGDTKPLAGVSTGNIGHFQDGGLDLLQPFGDRAAMDRYRACGSFLAPTLDALAERMSVDGERLLHVAVIGDGLLSDFDRVDVPPSMNLLGFVESAAAADRCRARWRDVVGSAALFGFDDRGLDEWFAARRARSMSHRWVRVITEAGAKARRIDPGGSSEGLNDAWFEQDFRAGPMRVAIIGQTSPWRLEARAGGGVVTLHSSVLAAAANLSEADLQAFKSRGRATARSSFPMIFDTASGGAASEAAWNAAVRAFDLAVTHQRWDMQIVSPLLAGGAAAVLCLANRVPAGTWSESDRLIVLALATQDDAVMWSADQPLPFGRPAVGWAIGYDRFEDRWMLRVEDASAPTHPTALHPSASQLLPAISTREGGAWVAAFSGPLSSNE